MLEVYISLIFCTQIPQKDIRLVVQCLLVQFQAEYVHNIIKFPLIAIYLAQYVYSLSVWEAATLWTL